MLNFANRPLVLNVAVERADAIKESVDSTLVRRRARRAKKNPAKQQVKRNSKSNSADLRMEQPMDERTILSPGPGEAASVGLPALAQRPL